MRKTKSNIWLQIAFASLIFAGCQKSVDTTPANGNEQTQSNTLSGARIAVDGCLATTDTVNGTGNGYTYTNWTPTSKVLGTGPTLQFEGHYNSFIRPLTASWYVGVINSDSACSDWDFNRRNNRQKCYGQCRFCACQPIQCGWLQKFNVWVGVLCIRQHSTNG
jgi:hypothetical protein